jgi:transposase
MADLNCRHCGRKCKSAAGLWHHERKCSKTHGNPTSSIDFTSTKFVCDRCNKPFKSIQGLNCHITKMHMGGGKGGRGNKKSRTIEVKFCPNCGCNLDIISKALAISKSLPEMEQ